MTKKYKVGYTTGVFDLFHIGHLNILKKAKEQCEYLIVGVSTDENVLNYKKKTPVIPFEERIAIVEALKYVDEVVPQTNMDKYQAWEKIKFEAIFHGDDWKGSKMYSEIERKFNEVGVDMVYFPYTKGTSSTILADVLAQAFKEKKGSNE
jgi:glycerol-3-phosphate cytidylyltransferase